jgi:hypothetical protein
MKVVQIKCNEDMIDLDLPIHLRNMKGLLQKHTCKSVNTPIQYLYSWIYEGSTIMCYGWITGEAGDENKHELPPDGHKHIQHIDNSDTQLLFGDIFMVMKQSTICNFDTSEYGLFYHNSFEGFDDCDSSEDSSEDGSEGTDDLNFIVNDSGTSSENYASENEGDSELEEDEEDEEDSELEEDEEDEEDEGVELEEDTTIYT